MKMSRRTLQFIVPAIVLVILTAALAGFACTPPGTIPASCQKWYDQGKMDGYTDGYNKGKIDGQTVGYSDGYTKGLQDGKSLCPQCPTCPTCPQQQQQYPYYYPYPRYYYYYGY